MASNTERYVLRGGKQGYDRLLVLARNRWPDTLALLRRAGIQPGMRSLDVGCGGGAVTFEIATLVGPAGTVVGLDMDGVKLELARKAAAERHLPNVEFRQSNVNDWNELAGYDLVYSRALLQHLRRPVEVLRRMWASVRPGGLLIVEDADFDGWCCDPPNAAFDFFVRTYGEATRQNGGDSTLGRKLGRHFRDAEIPDPELTVVQSVSTRGEAKGLAWSTLEYSSEAILAGGIATSAELRVALESLATFTEDPTTVISGPRIFQAWVRR
jgi:ubiquinone/menaquinone biosynthesis C-methylase UbiE